MVLKAYNVDGSSKMIAIHGGMSARDVCFMLADRNHLDLGPNWTIVEKLTDLHLGTQGNTHFESFAAQYYDFMSSCPCGSYCDSLVQQESMCRKYFHLT